MNEELPLDDASELDGEAAPVAPAAPDFPVALDELLLLLLDELLLDEAFVVPVAETVCPTSPDSETIVPSAGA